MNNSLSYVSVKHTDARIALQPDSQEVVKKYYFPTLYYIDKIADHVIAAIKAECQKILDDNYHY